MHNPIPIQLAERRRRIVSRLVGAEGDCSERKRGEVMSGEREGGGREGRALRWGILDRKERLVELNLLSGVIFLIDVFGFTYV
jgi:hypothetical protein